MQLSELRTAVRQRLGVPASDSFYTDAVLTSLTNEANRWIAAQWDWPWLEKTETITTVDAQQDNATAADYSATIAVVDSTGVPLERRPISDILRMGTGKAGIVRYFTAYGSKLVWRPVPNGNLSPVHYYRCTEPALANDGDTPLLPSQYHEAIVEYATAVALERRGLVSEAQARYKTVQTWIENMRARADRYSASTGGGAEMDGGA
jgi:hypothetical protein